MNWYIRTFENISIVLCLQFMLWKCDVNKPRTVDCESILALGNKNERIIKDCVRFLLIILIFGTDYCWSVRKPWFLMFVGQQMCLRIFISIILITTMLSKKWPEFSKVLLYRQISCRCKGSSFLLYQEEALLQKSVRHFESGFFMLHTVLVNYFHTIVKVKTINSNYS